MKLAAQADCHRAAPFASTKSPHPDFRHTAADIIRHCGKPLPSAILKQNSAGYPQANRPSFADAHGGDRLGYSRARALGSTALLLAQTPETAMRPTPLPLTSKMRATPQEMHPEIARQLEALMPDLMRVARQISTDWRAADNLAQRTLMALWTQADTLTPTPDILRRQAFEILRRTAAQEAAPGANVA